MRYVLVPLSHECRVLLWIRIFHRSKFLFYILVFKGECKEEHPRGYFDGQLETISPMSRPVSGIVVVSPHLIANGLIRLL
jgi:hypothetical protein